MQTGTPVLMILRAVLVLVLGVGPAAHAQPAWKPEKNVEIVVGLTAGSSQDRTARFLQNIWQTKGFVSSAVTVNNRVGGAGNIAWATLATHPGTGTSCVKS